MKIWKSIDQSHNHSHILPSDDCRYAREFKIGQKGSDQDTNDLVINFKKPPGAKGKFYRDRDLKTFALELSRLFKKTSKTAITAIPSSKQKNDREYTKRFEDCFEELLTHREQLQVEWPIEISKTVKSSHSGGSRDPDEIKANYVWNDFSGDAPDVLVVIDDVITTGSHFRAFSDFLRENGYEGKIVGIFWARSVSPSAADVFDIVESEDD